jgi:hypothetical protein
MSDNAGIETERNADEITTNIWFYITPGMIMTVIVPVVLIALSAEQLWKNLNTNLPLNSTIILVAIVAIIKAFLNNIKVRQSAQFIHEIERLEGQTEITPQDSSYLFKLLRTKGSLMDIQNMFTALENMSVHGYLNLTDNDARLIKSKYGNRINTERQIVNYFAGILVMMGLIGTFLGLLQTIDSVGSAMGDVSDSFKVIPGAPPVDPTAKIGSFIESIAAPLQGMGLAFSSSLFGLTGSLLLGFINFFGGRAQNKCIENFSRWVDNRIPKLNPVLGEKIKSHNVPGANDLKAWLAGFVYLSSKTNQRMGQIFLALTKSAQATMKSAQQTEKMFDGQQDMVVKLEQINTKMSSVKDSMAYITKNVDPSLRYSESIRDQMVYMSEMLSSTLRVNEDLAMKQSDKLSVLTNQMREMNSTFESMNSVQSSLIKEIDKLQQRQQQEDNVADFSNMVWQLNQIMEEMNQKNQQQFDGVYDVMDNASQEPLTPPAVGEVPHKAQATKEAKEAKERAEQEQSQDLNISDKKPDIDSFE